MPFTVLQCVNKDIIILYVYGPCVCNKDIVLLYYYYNAS